MQRQKRSLRAAPVLLATIAAATAGIVAAAPAQAAPAPVVSGLTSPLTLSVDHGKLFVTQNQAGKLSRYHMDGSGGTDLFTRDPSKVEVGGVEAKGPGTLFTVTGAKFAQLDRLTAGGKKVVKANLYAFEHTVNPDRNHTYGFRNLSKSCASQVPAEVGGGDPIKGAKDSHPYGVARGAHGNVYVADAAGNDILKVSRGGHISVVAVLPPQPLKVTMAKADATGLPHCTIGHRYFFEPVPTDVEWHKGWLYVTTLPGGPEDPSLGARGKVYRINSHNGHWKVVGRHLAGATGVAVSAKGRVFAAELFGNRISTFKHGHRVTVTDLDQPAAVEWAHGHLWATSGVFTPDGSIVKIW